MDLYVNGLTGYIYLGNDVNKKRTLLLEMETKRLMNKQEKGKDKSDSTNVEVRASTLRQICLHVAKQTSSRWLLYVVTLRNLRHHNVANATSKGLPRNVVKPEYIL